MLSATFEKPEKINLDLYDEFTPTESPPNANPNLDRVWDGRALQPAFHRLRGGFQGRPLDGSAQADCKGQTRDFLFHVGRCIAFGFL